MDLKWCDFDGSRLIRSASLMVGGKMPLEWRCKKCRKTTPDSPSPPAVCGRRRRWISIRKLREAVRIRLGELYGVPCETLSDSDITEALDPDNLISSQFDQEFRNSISGLYRREVCQSIVFEKVTREFPLTCLDQYESQTLSMWKTLSEKKET